MPSNKAAWLTKLNQPLEVFDAPFPIPGADDVIIRTQAVAMNPADWKQQENGIFIKAYPHILGLDVAGFIEEVGSNVTSLTKGDRVISNAIHLSNQLPSHSAFQLYVQSPSNITAKLPSHIPFSNGCVLPLAINTAADALYSQTKLNLTLPSLHPTQDSTDVLLIYGGSTSVGSTAIQLARASGLTVYTTASPRNHAHCIALGADPSGIFDYNDPEWTRRFISALQPLSGGNQKTLIGIFDTVAHGDTTRICADLYAQLGKKEADAPIVCTNYPPEGVKATTVFGTDVTLDDGLARGVWGFVEEALKVGRFMLEPKARIVGNGLESIQMGMDVLRKGVSNEKVVVTVE